MANVSYLTPDLSYWLLPLPILNYLNEKTPQSVIVDPGNPYGPFRLQVIRIVKPFRLEAFTGSTGDIEFKTHNVFLMVEWEPKMWVADTPDILELLPENPFWVFVSEAVRKGWVKVKRYTRISDAKDIRVSGFWEPKGFIPVDVPSGRLDELTSGSFVEGEVVMELVPKNSGLA
jgi:hypothetical protein